MYVSFLILASILLIDKRGIIYFRAFIFLILRQAEVPSVERRLSTGAKGTQRAARKGSSPLTRKSSGEEDSQAPAIRRPRSKLDDRPRRARIVRWLAR